MEQEPYDYDMIIDLINQNADFVASTPNGKKVNVTQSILNIVSSIKMRCLNEEEFRPTKIESF